MLDFSKSLERRLRRAGLESGGEFGMRFFEFEQLAEHPVVFGVRDFRSVFYVVEVVVVFEFLTQLGDPGGYAVDVIMVLGHSCVRERRREFSVAMA